MTMKKTAVHCDHAPAALGPYSQGIRVGDTVYISGQLGLDPVTGTLADTNDAQANQAFKNVRAIAQAAGGDLDGIVKLTLLMADLDDFAKVNEIMTTFFTPPYPARATYPVAALPKAGRIEVEAVLVLPSMAPSAQTGWRETFDATKAA
jgi:reactive intermediate/imine deaminase